MEIPLINRLSQIQHPILIIVGMYDRNTEVTISNIVHRELPNSRMLLFNESAHFPDIEETKNFIKVVQNFSEA